MLNKQVYVNGNKWRLYHTQVLKKTNKAEKYIKYG